tara:strand:- start:677 stop:1429 length:753 start_codon:yes stop_codon:yes gene_type:complete
MTMMDEMNLSLDADEINKQAAIESLMPAKLITCEYKDITFTDNRDGTTQIRKAWVLEWDRLDRDMTGASGKKFTYQSTHWLPDGSRPVTNRREMQYAKQVACFASVGLRGRVPEDFLGVEHWIRETMERNTTRSWWKSEAKYVEGQSYEEATGKEVTNMNPPAASPAPKEEVQEEVIALDDDSPYSLFIETIDGMTHRQAITAIKKTDGLKDNEEIVNGLTSGSLIDQMITQKLLKEEDGKYYKIEKVEA